MRDGIEVHTERFRVEIDGALNKMNRIGYKSPEKLMNGTNPLSGKKHASDKIPTTENSPARSTEEPLTPSSALDSEISIPDELPPPLLPTIVPH